MLNLSGISYRCLHFLSVAPNIHGVFFCHRRRINKNSLHLGSDAGSLTDLIGLSPPSLTQDYPAVLPVHFEQPGPGGLGPVVGELLQALAVHLQRVLVGEAAEGLDFYGGFGFAAAHDKGFLPNQLEHPVFSDDFLSEKCSELSLL